MPQPWIEIWRFSSSVANAIKGPYRCCPSGDFELWT